MNPILDKNLENINKLNPNLYKDLKSVTALTNDIELVQNEKQQYNLAYNSKYIHDFTDPEIEAKNILNSVASNTNNTIHVIFGLGLGYLFNEFCENAKGKIILFEPSLEIFRAVLDFVDFSKEFSRGEVFLVNDSDSLKSAVFENYIAGTRINFVFLDFYKEVFRQDFENLLKELQQLKTLGDIQVMVQKHQGEEFINSTLRCLDKKIFIPPLTVLKDCLKNKPALIVSAGPSLNKEIETIKNNRDKFVIFCVGTAYKALLANGIQPDFLNIIEAQDVSAQISSVDTSSVNFICEPYTNCAFYRADFKRRFFTCSNENIANVWFSKLLRININDYETKGTVSYNAMYSAKIMGCNPIILVGQDLAFPGGKCYAENSAYSSLKIVSDIKTGEPKITVENLGKFCKKYSSNYNDANYSKDELKKLAQNDLAQMNSELTQVMGYNGRNVLTNYHYALFVTYFEDFAKRYGAELKLFNTSKDGAKIEGFKYRSLADITSKLEETVSVEDALKDKRSFLIPDFESIISDLEKESYLLTRVITMMQQQIQNVRNFDREIARYKRLTVSANEYLKKALNTFIDIINNYQPESKILDIVTYDKKTQLAYALKEYDGNYEYKVQRILAEKLLAYYSKAADLNSSLKLLLQGIEEIKTIYENIDTKG